MIKRATRNFEVLNSTQIDFEVDNIKVVNVVAVASPDMACKVLYSIPVLKGKAKEFLVEVCARKK